MADLEINNFPWTLDWNLLRTFTVVVEQGGITRAANFLGVKQPTVSNAITRLEKSVHCRLLERRPNYFRVTAMGHKLYAECSALFGCISQLPSILANNNSTVTGHIAMAMASHVVSHHFDRVLELFNARFPKVTYSIDVTYSTEVASRVRQNRVSLGIGIILNKEPGLEKTVLYRESFGLFCGPKHRLYGKEKIDSHQVEHENIVAFLPDIESGAQNYLSQLYKSIRIKPEIKGVSTNLPEIRRMIIANIGIGCMPVHVAKRDMQDGRIWQIPPYSKLPRVDVCLLINPARSRNPAESAFIDMVKEMIAIIPIEERTY